MEKQNSRRVKIEDSALISRNIYIYGSTRRTRVLPRGSCSCVTGLRSPLNSNWYPRTGPRHRGHHLTWFLEFFARQIESFRDERRTFHGLSIRRDLCKSILMGKSAGIFQDRDIVPRNRFNFSTFNRSLTNPDPCS